MSSRLTLLYLVMQAEDHAKMNMRGTINAPRPCNSLFVSFCYNMNF